MQWARPGGKTSAPAVLWSWYRLYSTGLECQSQDKGLESFAASAPPLCRVMSPKYTAHHLGFHSRLSCGKGLWGLSGLSGEVMSGFRLVKLN